jgi:hypothetical protein
VSNRPPEASASSLPRPLLWAIVVCLVALAAIAVIAVACLAGFTPQQLINLVHATGGAARSARG